MRYGCSGQVLEQDGAAGMGLATSEQELAYWMIAAIAGDAVAYRLFLDVATPHLWSVARYHCCRLGTYENDVADIVQEVLLAIHLTRGTWDQSRPISPWLAGIVRNKCVDMLRQRRRHFAIPIDAVSDVLVAPEAHSGMHAQDVERALARLKGTQREIVRSISIDGLSPRETAMHLAMSEGAVRVALHRGLRRLALAFRDSPIG